MVAPYKRCHLLCQTWPRAIHFRVCKLLPTKFSEQLEERVDRLDAVRSSPTKPMITHQAPSRSIQRPSLHDSSALWTRPPVLLPSEPPVHRQGKVLLNTEELDLPAASERSLWLQRKQHWHTCGLQCKLHKAASLITEELDLPASSERSLWVKRM